MSGCIRRVLAVLCAVLGAVGLVTVAAQGAAADSLVPINVNDAAVVKPASGTTTMSFLVTLGYKSHNTVSASWSTQDNTALAGRDYQAASGVVVFAPGVTSHTVSVTVTGNTLDTGNRSFNLNLSQPQNAVVGHNATGTIQSNSPRPYLSVQDTGTTVGYAGTGNATFHVTLSAASSNTVTVKYRTSDGSARAGVNYTAQTGTLTFAPGVTDQSVVVPLTGRVPAENAYWFGMNISNPTNAGIGSSVGYAYVTDPDRSAYVTVDDTTVSKPSTGSANASITVRLLQPATFPVSVDYYTSNDSATAGTDYTSESGTVTFPAGSTTQTIQVPVLANAGTLTRDFYVNLTDASAGTLYARSAGTVTIAVASYATKLSVQDTGVIRPTSGSATEVFTVVAQPAPTSPLQFNYATQDGSAVAGTDYTATSGTGTIAAGASSTTINVPVAGGTSLRGDRYLAMNLSGAPILRPTGYGYILPAAASQQTPHVSVDYAAAVRATSGNTTMQVPVVLAPSSANTVTVNFATADGSATAGADYQSASGTVTFNPGDTVKFIPVTILPKATPGNDVSFSVVLSSPSNAAIDTSSQSELIRNTTTAPVLTVDDAAQFRPITGTGTMTFTAHLSYAVAFPVSFHYATSDGSAVSGTDYTPTSGTATIAAGAKTATVKVKLPFNTGSFTNPVFYLNLSSVVNASLARSYAMATIVSDNVKPYLTVHATTAVVGATATTAVFHVELSAPSANAVTVNYATSDGSATSGTDYTATSGSLSFSPGTTSKNVTVPVPANAAATTSKYFYLNLSNATFATIERSYSTATLEYTNVPSELSMSDTAVTRQTSGTKNVTVPVTLSPANAKTVTVQFHTQDGTATAGTDYSSTSGTLTFNPGDTVENITVPITASSTARPDRYFYVDLASPTGAVLQRSDVQVEIVDTVSPSGNSYASVSDSTVVAPTSGSATASFTVSIAPANTQPVRISYATNDGTAVAGNDYTSVQGTLTFAAGQTSKTVSVPVSAVSSAQPNRYFTLGIRLFSGPVVAESTNSGTGQILNAVPNPVITVGRDQSIVRGASGTQTVTFPVTISPTATTPVTVDYTTNDGSAVAGRDYDTATGTLTFAPGQSERDVTVTVYGDSTASTTRYFTLQIGNPTGGSIADSTAYGYLDPADTFDIAGRVTDPSGAGIAGVTVTRTGGNQPAAAVTTAANGTYDIPNSVSGKYTLTATGGGLSYYPLSLPATVSAGVVNVTSQGMFLGYTGKVIAGRTWTPTGTPLAGATVTRSGNSQSTASAVTNAGGEYAIATSVSGTYGLAATATGYDGDAPNNYTVTVGSASSLVGDLFLVTNSSIGVHLVTSGGSGVDGATVTVTGPATQTVKVDENGYYPLSGLPAGTYTVTPTLTGHSFTPSSTSVSISAGSPGSATFTEN